MPEMVWRGFVPTDEREFHGEGLRRLRRAQEDVLLLLDRGYRMPQSVKFVGDRFQLSARQRTALMRATCSSAARKGRRSREMPAPPADGTLLIDGFNLVITMEAALSGSTVLRCMDGALRDLCGLRGTYRVIGHTAAALRCICDRLEAWQIARAVWVLDAPVSNSGRLAGCIRAAAVGRPFETGVELTDRADSRLLACSCVATTDSVILDRCAGWVNLAAQLAAALPDFSPVRLDGPDSSPKAERTPER